MVEWGNEWREKDRVCVCEGVATLREWTHVGMSRRSGAQGEASRPSKTTTHVESEFFGSCRYVEEFQKLDRLGEGTYGTVHRARFIPTGQIFALKKIKVDGEHEGVPMTTLREITLLRRLQHENIVSLKEVVVGSKLNSMFLAFEYCEHDMAQLLDTMSKPFSLSCVKCLMLQLLKAVSFLHENWVLHRYANRGID